MWLKPSRTYDPRHRLDGKTAIITGSSSGLGKFTAKDFYRRGCKVLMACRNTAKAEKAKQDILNEGEALLGPGELLVRRLDMSSFDSIRGFVDQVLREESEIHILINNAGVCGESGHTEDGLDVTMATNYFGPFLLTLLLLPRMMKSAPARIINVSSLMFLIGRIYTNDLTMTKDRYSTTSTYSSSKLASVLFTRKLGRMLEGTGVTTYSLHPGFIYTDIVKNLQPLLRIGGNIFLWPFWTTVEQGAQSHIHCAVDRAAQEETGLFYFDCRASRILSHARNSTSNELWHRSLRIVGLGDFDPFSAVHPRSKI